MPIYTVSPKKTIHYTLSVILPNIDRFGFIMNLLLQSLLVKLFFEI